MIAVPFGFYSSLPPRKSAFLWGARKTGNEVDFILRDGEIAVEVNGTNRVDKADLRSITIFQEEYKSHKSIVVCNEKYPRKHGEI